MAGVTTRIWARSPSSLLRNRWRSWRIDHDVIALLHLGVRDIECLLTALVHYFAQHRVVHRRQRQDISRNLLIHAHQVQSIAGLDRASPLPRRHLRQSLAE